MGLIFQFVKENVGMEKKRSTQTKKSKKTEKEVESTLHVEMWIYKEQGEGFMPYKKKTINRTS